MTYPDAVRRAGHADGNALFEAMLAGRSGVTFTVHEYEDDFALIAHADHKIALEMPEMLDEMRGLRDAHPALTTPEFPIVLSAGERRAYTANDIFRDPCWRKRDERRRAARQRRGRAAARPGRRRARADHDRGGQRRGQCRGQRRHAARARLAAQRLTASTSPTTTARRRARCRAERAHVDGWRDAYAGTPWHKHVPARIEAVKEAAAAAAG